MNKNDKLELEDIPNALTYKRWRKSALRSISQVHPNYLGAMVWAQMAFMKNGTEYVTTMEQLGDSGEYGRLDMMIADCLMKKLNRISSSKSPNPHMRHLACEVEREDTERQSRVPCVLLTGREILRLIDIHMSDRADHGQVYTYADLMKVQIKGHGKQADEDLFHFYDEWLKIWGEMGEIHHSFMPSIQEHFHAQMRKCPSMELTLSHYNLCDDAYGTGKKSFHWLLQQISREMLKDRQKHNRDVRKTDINKRGLGNGATGSGSGNDNRPRNKLGQVKKEITCKKWLNNRCPFTAHQCQYAHKKLDPPAAPATGGGGGRGGGGGGGGGGKGRRDKPTKPTGPKPNGPKPDKREERKRTNKGGNTPRGSSRGSGSSSARSGSSAGRDSSNTSGRSTPRTGPAQGKGLCYAYSRGNCKTPCPHGREHKANKAYTAEEKKKRDTWEQKIVSSGKQLPYARSDQQAAAAASNASQAAAPADGGGKGKKKGKGKGDNASKTCNNWTTTGKCDFGERCWFRANTPGHP